MNQMIGITILLIIFALEILGYKFILNIIYKYDDEVSPGDIRNNKRVNVIFLIVTLLFFIKFGISINFFFLTLLAYYLIISAYIDFKTMIVYSIFNYTMILFSIMFYSLSSYSVEKINLIILILFIIFSIVLEKMGMYGNGDTEIYIVIACFFATVCRSNLLETLLIDMVLANIIIIFINIKKFDLKKLKFKEKVAFIPAIAISTIILCLI